MRILIATPYLPWPLVSGGNSALFSTLKCLSADHRFTLVSPVTARQRLGDLRRLQAELPGVIIRGVFCRPAWEHWFRPKPAVRGPYNPFSPVPKAMLRALEEEIALGTDLCQAEFAEMMALGNWFPSTIPKVFVHYQVHWVYARRFLETRGTSDALESSAEKMKRTELAHLSNFDGVLTVSERDREVLGESIGMTKVFSSPPPFPSDVRLSSGITGGFENRFVFVGSEAHFPNQDALEWLLEAIWPEIRRELPDAKLIIAGKWSRRWSRFGGHEGIHFSGHVEDLSAALKGGILLAPVRIASGVQTKVLSAFAAGAPVLATPVVCEGLGVRVGSDLLVASEAREFAAEAVSLARNPGLWRKLAAAGLEVAGERFAPEATRKRRNDFYSTIESEFRSRRGRGSQPRPHATN